MGRSLDILTIYLDTCFAAGNFYRLRDYVYKRHAKKHGDTSPFDRIKNIDFYVVCEWDEKS